MFQGNKVVMSSPKGDERDSDSVRDNVKYKILQQFATKPVIYLRKKNMFSNEKRIVSRN